MNDTLELATVEQAAAVFGKTVDEINEYILARRIGKYNAQGKLIVGEQNGHFMVSLKEIRVFLYLLEQGLEKHHHAGLHPELGFHDVPEHQRTKHVHRLHPYLGKFIPQLVEWFLARYFKPDDVILDPFMGSGTTLIQGNEMKMHTIGIDISPFNCLIAKVKAEKYDLAKARQELLDIERRVARFSKSLQNTQATLPLFPDNNIETITASLMAE